MYVKPEIEIINFDTEDVILTSSADDVLMTNTVGNDPRITAATISVGEW